MLADALGRAIVVVGHLTSGILSALLVNDTVCLMFTPLPDAVLVRGGLPLPPFLLALAMSASIGSACTLVGDPQNMIIGHRSGIGSADYFFAALFIVVHGFNEIGLPDRLFVALQPWFGGNVPMRAGIVISLLPFRRYSGLTQIFRNRTGQS